MRSARVFENKAFKTKEVAGGRSRATRVIVKKINLPVMTEAELAESILLGSGTIHSLRHPGRQPRLPDPQRRPSAPKSAGTMDVLLVAAKKEKDRRLHRRDISQAGRVPVVVDVDAFALQERLRGELRSRAGTPSSSC